MILIANGTAVVNYFYDSWGNMLNITGSMAANLGKDNPYRFKALTNKVKSAYSMAKRFVKSCKKRG